MSGAVNANRLSAARLIENQRVKLVKPQTFMNLSGDAVSCLISKPELECGRSLIVISDDLALPFGSIRLRQRGSAGGHNGLKSIIGALGTNEFIRLRIGIQPDHPISDAKEFRFERIHEGRKRIVGGNFRTRRRGDALSLTRRRSKGDVVV